MTTQEFVKKEAKIYWAISETKDPEENFADGLTKGLELAKEFSNWVTKETVEYHYNRKSIFDGRKGTTDDELLTIFLTEKYGK